MGSAMNGIPAALQLRVLEAVAPALEPGSYLVGGVAVGLNLRHRLSVDVDIFVPHDFDPARLLARLQAETQDCHAIGEAPGTLHLEVHGVPVSILSYRYPLLRTPRVMPGVALPVAAVEDLVCMKLAAIAGRGAAKDFWDLDSLLAAGAFGTSLSTALDAYCTKYANHDRAQIVKSLAYFGDADAAPLPRGLAAGAWASMKARIAEQVRSL
jgi:hypothetical protein